MDLYPIAVNKTCMENSPLFKVQFIEKVDFGGTLVLNICENFYNEELIKDFIDICKELDINFEIEKEYQYEQANLRMAKL